MNICVKYNLLELTWSMAPQEQEIEADVTGSIPNWVKGSLMMNGVARVEGGAIGLFIF